MELVFTTWYFVMIALVAGVAACLIIFFKMDKQDGVLIDKFVKDSQAGQEEPAKEEAKTE